MEEGARTTSPAVCFICFDAEQNVVIAGCHHRMCGACTKALVEDANPSKVLACPFCCKVTGGLSIMKTDPVFVHSAWFAASIYAIFISDKMR